MTRNMSYVLRSNTQYGSYVTLTKHVNYLEQIAIKRALALQESDAVKHSGKEPSGWPLLPSS